MQTWQRNNKIMRLRGAIPLLKSLPQDIQDVLGSVKVDELIYQADQLLNAINTVKVKRFTCATCTDTSGLSITHNKRAYGCDICNSWGVTLYNIKGPK